MAHLLINDHDPVQTPRQVRRAFPVPSHRVDVAAAGTEGLERVRTRRREVMLRALRLSNLSGLEVHDKIGRLGVRISVIFGTSIVCDNNISLAGDTQ